MTAPAGQSALRGALPHFMLKFDGKDASADIMRNLREVRVESSLHLADAATILIRDADVTLIDDDHLTLGVKVEITVDVNGNTDTIFDGEIVEVEPHYQQHDQFIQIRAFDRLHRLTRGTHARSFRNVSDMDIVKKIAAEVGLKAQTGSATHVHDYVFQNNQSNLAFLQERAALIGYVLYVDGQTLHCVPPKGQEEAIELQWGVNLVEFLPRLSSLRQPTKTTVRGWDPEKKAAVVGQVGRGEGTPETGETRKADSVTQEAFRQSAPHAVTHHVVREQGLAEMYAQASVNRQHERLIEATGVCGGHPRITAGTPLKIKKVGKRFEGTYYVTSATHTYRSDRGYLTEFSVSGQEPTGIAHMLGVRPQPNLQRGMAVAIVTNNDDPKGQGRVKLKYPWLTEQDESDWARVVALGAGPDRGIQYLPEVNDEVLVAFEQGDIHHPYVIGGLWNGMDAPPKSSKDVVKGGRVQQRVIRSRKNHWIVLDDSDGSPHILIKDSGGNTIKIDSKSNTLTIEMQGDVKVKATRSVDISGNGVKIDGGPGGVDIKGVNVKVNGDALVDIKGGVIKLN